ncbi:MAG: AMP-binding protein, partial [Nitrospirae bacterium]|nr:AMP-binding protein [Nitrospirota bacterium]
LVEAGIRRGEVVGIYSDHTPAQVIAIFAIAMADGVFTIINSLLKDEQIKHQISDANVTIIIGTKDFLSRLDELFINRQITAIELSTLGLLNVVTVDSKDIINPDELEISSIPADVSNIIYTSGSTGLSKGVVISHRTLLDGARIVSGYLNITDKDIILSILPFSFDYGLNQLLTVIYTGAAIVLQKYIFPKDLIEVLIKEHITAFAAVPSLWPGLLNSKTMNQKDKSEFKNLRYITTAGGVHRKELLIQLTTTFPDTEIIIMYGLTESFRSTYLPFSEIFKREGSIGKAVPEVEIIVLNDKGEHCLPGQKGELIHRGAFVDYGYLNNPELTNQRYIKLNTGGSGCIEEIAVRSGDLVSKDEDGFIYYHGRIDSQIKSRGYRISPEEVETIVLAFKSVRNAAVISCPDNEFGESVNVAYETIDNIPVDHKNLMEHLKKFLPYYAVPKEIYFYEHLPTTSNGKIDYPAIRRNAISNNGISIK